MSLVVRRSDASSFGTNYERHIGIVGTMVDECERVDGHCFLIDVIEHACLDCLPSLSLL